MDTDKGPLILEVPLSGNGINFTPVDTLSHFSRSEEDKPRLDASSLGTFLWRCLSGDSRTSISAVATHGAGAMRGLENRRLAKSVGNILRAFRSILKTILGIETCLTHPFEPSKNVLDTPNVKTSISKPKGLPCTTPYAGTNGVPLGTI